MRSDYVMQDIENGLANAQRLARDARERFVAWRGSRLAGRGLLLYLLGTPLLLAAPLALLFGNLSVGLSAGASWVLIMLAGYLNRRGILETLVAGDRRYTRGARLPLQYGAASLLAAAAGLLAHGVIGHGMLVSLVFAAIAVAGFHLVYRLPNPVAWRRSAFGDVSDRAVRRALQQAESRLIAIEKAAFRVADPDLEARLLRIARKGQQVLALLMQRPADLFRARQFLNVHLEGAERVVSRYAASRKLLRDTRLDDRLAKVLDRIETAFERQQQNLAKNEAFDLDVQIEVLRKQLKQEGIA
jgi:5-bromo-4-chloroindolyl phosphate hydrolysis protein